MTQTPGSPDVFCKYKGNGYEYAAPSTLILIFTIQINAYKYI